jgi:thiamine biosynthesis lipoprotein
MLIINKTYKVLRMTLLFIFCLSACSDSKEITARSKLLLNTFVEIKACGKNAEMVINEAFIEMERVNSLLNNYDNESEVSKINKFSGERSVNISPETMDVLQTAVKFSDITGGAFDFTIGPLLKLWGFAKENAGLDSDNPTPEEIEKAKEFVNYRALKLEKVNNGTNTIRFAKLLKKGMYIDVGAFSKGYVADRAMEIINNNGIKDALISAGGTIIACGEKPDKSSWKIGIRHPRKEDTFLSFVDLKDRAVSTSGDYEKYFKKKNKRFTHIIDPRTGMPVDRHQSVTVMAMTGVESDALSTALFVMGTKEGVSLVNSLPGVDALIIDHEGKVFMSKDWPQKTVIY